MKKRIGIFGGSFDPIHNGHLIMAQDAQEAFNLTKVVFVPCNKPSHKTMNIASPEHRLAMLKLALKNCPGLEISDVDIQRGGITYTIDTLNELTPQLPDAELHFIIGSDTLIELHQWRAIDQLLNLCVFDTIVRPEFDPALIQSLNLPAPWPDRLSQNTTFGHLIDISSSDIRKRIASGMTIKGFTPEDVEIYIAKNRLYNVF